MMHSMDFNRRNWRGTVEKSHTQKNLHYFVKPITGGWQNFMIRTTLLLL